MRLLVDVNIFIDVLTKRMNWEGSLGVLHVVRQSSDVEGWISALTIPLLYFFRLRVAEEMQARADVQTAVKGFRLVPLSQDIIDKALLSALPDFEDNLQMASAEMVAADYIITRNKRHFQGAESAVLTPEEWLALDSVVGLMSNL